MADLPEEFSLRHPYIGRVTTLQTVQDQVDLNMLSVNWCLADNLIEIVDNSTGKSVPQ